MSSIFLSNNIDQYSNIKGILWMVLAGLFFSSMVGLIKLLGQRIPSYEIVFFRSITQLIVVAGVFLRIGFSGLKTERPFLHGLRTLIAIVLINCNFYVFTKLPVAEVTAIGFTRNLFLALFAILILSEKVTITRLTVLIFGFIGILFIARPGEGSFDGVMLIALGAAALGAAMMIMIRKLTTTESNLIMMTYPAVGIVLATLIPTILLWTAPTYCELLLLILMSLFGIIGQWAMIQAFRYGEATAISSAGYTRIIFATIVGYCFFDQFPDTMTMMGIMIIVGSNILLITQEARRDKTNLKKQIHSTKK